MREIERETPGTDTCATYGQFVKRRFKDRDHGNIASNLDGFENSRAKICFLVYTRPSFLKLNTIGGKRTYKITAAELQYLFPSGEKKRYSGSMLRSMPEPS